MTGEQLFHPVREGVASEHQRTARGSRLRRILSSARSRSNRAASWSRSLGNDRPVELVVDLVEVVGDDAGAACEGVVEPVRGKP